MREPRSRGCPSGRRVGRSLLAAGLVMLVVSCSSSKGPPGSDGPAAAGSATSTHGSASPSATLTVASTLDGRTALPHRIHWQAKPSVPAGDVSEVDFLIDGQMAWVEHNSPYFFGDDGGYLVTTFLSSGKHSITVGVITTGGQSAESAVTAEVGAPPTPPAELAGISWTHTMTASDQKKAGSEPPPTGRWGLTIDPVGWLFADPEGGGQLWDVAYRSGRKVELRTTIEQPPYPSPLGGSICGEPDRSALWTYTIGDGGNTLTLHPVGHDPCGDRVAILEGSWTTK